MAWITINILNQQQQKGHASNHRNKNAYRTSKEELSILFLNFSHNICIGTSNQDFIFKSKSLLDLL
jgi:hypothetical protein